jgi:hypothetical protein
VDGRVFALRAPPGDRLLHGRDQLLEREGFGQERILADVGRQGLLERFLWFRV